jgi:hypothetical protein
MAAMQLLVIYVLFLTVLFASAGDSGTTTIIGNFQQQNMHIAYDLGINKLFFVPARCDRM